jgi:hypothetical protein
VRILRIGIVQCRSFLPVLRNAGFEYRRRRDFGLYDRDFAVAAAAAVEVIVFILVANVQFR